HDDNDDGADYDDNDDGADYDNDDGADYDDNDDGADHDDNDDGSDHNDHHDGADHDDHDDGADYDNHDGPDHNYQHHQPRGCGIDDHVGSPVEPALTDPVNPRYDGVEWPGDRRGRYELDQHSIRGSVSGSASGWWVGRG
ncbi:MAG: hypothetical protein KDB31_06385, partial [Microthrixaceae bacterium]|nr:hypothetical protein [Microthrixaceae bacterium]